MFTEITSQEQLNEYKKYINTLDNVINKIEIKIKSETNIEDINIMLDFINRARISRLGVWNLCTIYELTNKEKEPISSYSVKDNVTLLDISNAFYGEPQYWEFIYVYNKLTTDILYTGQILLIPKLEGDFDVPYFTKEILENDGISLEEYKNSRGI